MKCDIFKISPFSNEGGDEGNDDTWFFFTSEGFCRVTCVTENFLSKDVFQVGKLDIFSVVKATLQLQMSVHPFVCPQNLLQP